MKCVFRHQDLQMFGLKLSEYVIEWLQCFLWCTIPYTTLHTPGLCTTSMTNIRPERDSNLEPQPNRINHRSRHRGLRHMLPFQRDTYWPCDDSYWPCGDSYWPCGDSYWPCGGSYWPWGLLNDGHRVWCRPILSLHKFTVTRPLGYQETVTEKPLVAARILNHRSDNVWEGRVL